MTFEQYLEVVRDWQSRLTPEEVRRCIESLSRMDIIDLPQGIDVSVDRVMAIAAGVASMPVPEVKGCDGARARRSCVNPRRRNLRT